jgi:hypothetical protein
LTAKKTRAIADGQLSADIILNKGTSEDMAKMDKPQ